MIKFGSKLSLILVKIRMLLTLANLSLIKSRLTKIFQTNKNRKIKIE